MGRGKPVSEDEYKLVKVLLNGDADPEYIRNLTGLSLRTIKRVRRASDFTVYREMLEAELSRPEKPEAPEPPAEDPEIKCLIAEQNKLLVQLLGAVETIVKELIP